MFDAESDSTGGSGRERFTVVLSGDVDLQTHDDLNELHEAYRRSGAPHVDVDLRGVTFFDSTGVAFLAHLVKDARARGGQVRLVGAPPTVSRVLEITGLKPYVEFVDSDRPGR